MEESKLKKFENFEEDWNEEEKEYEGLIINTYIRGSKEEGMYKADQLGISPDDPLYEEMIYLNYEVKLTYKVINGKPIMISVDDKKIINDEKI